jgi:hypothetical protein
VGGLRNSIIGVVKSNKMDLITELKVPLGGFRGGSPQKEGKLI